MAKIKVHELAKELELQSKDILSFLQEKGIAVSYTHLTASAGMVSFWQKECINKECIILRKSAETVLKQIVRGKCREWIISMLSGWAA